MHSKTLSFRMSDRLGTYRLSFSRAVRREKIIGSKKFGLFRKVEEFVIDNVRLFNYSLLYICHKI